MADALDLGSSGISRGGSSPPARTHAQARPTLAAIPPAIAAATLALPSDVTSLAEDAATEIARFDADLGHELAPFSAVLLRTESAASSRIENLTASARAIAEAELAPFGASSAALIVANTSAMSAAVALAERIDPEAILAMHRALLERSQPEIAGRWRDDQVWIGGHALGPHDALFVPPHHSRVRSAIDDLIAYIERDDVPILAHAAASMRSLRRSTHSRTETVGPAERSCTRNSETRGSQET